MTFQTNSSISMRNKFSFWEKTMTPLKFIANAMVRALTSLLFLGLTSQLATAGIAPNSAIFEKTGIQIDCDYVQYDLYYTHKFHPAENQNFIAATEIDFSDILPAGLAIQTITISGDVTGAGGGPIPAYEIVTVETPSDAFSWKNLYLSKSNLDGIGADSDRNVHVKIITKIDKSKFPVSKLVSNQAIVVTKLSGVVFGAITRSHDPALPFAGVANPTFIQIDVTDCPEDTDGGDPGVVEQCFKVEEGEVECDLENPGDFIYKMHVGAEYGGKTIELVSTTPGVTIFPPSQIVPLGGGTLIWHIHGAVPGMSVHLVATGLTDGDVKHVFGPKDGLGLCCTQKIEIIIPVDLDCPPPPPPCEEGDNDCLPPDDGCKLVDADCLPPIVICDPTWNLLCPPPPCDPAKEVCDPPVDKKDPKLELEKKVIDEFCLQNGDGTALCTYEITITNNGDAPYNGPLTILDSYPNGAPISSTFSPTPPWNCGPDGGADKFKCDRNIILPIGAFETLTVSTIVSINDYPSREVKNCALLQEQKGNPESCDIAKLPDPQTPGKPDLKLSKSCETNIAGTSAGFVSCRITVTNNGAAAPVGPITINDVTSLVGGGGAVATQSVTPDAPAADWTCSAVPTNNLICSIDGSKVGPGVSRSFEMTFNFGALQQSFKNCAQGIEADEGNGTPIDKVCVEGGASKPPAPIGEDTSGISVEKTGDSVCEPGIPCVFDITFKNGDKNDFNGQIAIVDGITNTGGGLFNGAQVVSIEPPFGCAQTPTSLPFGCTAEVSLGAGESRTHKVTVIMPQTQTGAAGSGLQNCVMVGEPGILDADVDEIVSTAPGNDNRSATVGQHTSCHSFTVNEPVQCSSGMVLNKAGNCQCASGTRWNGRRCFGKPPVIPPIIVPPIDPPLSIVDPVCPRGMDRFRSFSGKPLGYSLKWVNSNGKRIICGAPSCDRGWSLYNSRSAIPRGWSKKQIGRPNSRYKFWCAKPQKTLDLQCWNSSWTQITFSQIKSYKNKGFDVKPRSKRGKTIWCARPGQRVDNCPTGWSKFPKGQAPKGWITTKRLYDNGRNVCAKKTNDPSVLQCWSKKWTKIWLGEVRAYQNKGYTVKRRGKGKRTIWCAKPGITSSCVPGLNEYRNTKNQCVCKRGYERQAVVGASYQCVKIVTLPPPATCPGGWKKISSSQRTAYINKGYQVKSPGGRGVAIVWCAKPKPRVDNCPTGWTKFKNGKRPKGWITTRRLYDNGRNVCAKPAGGGGTTTVQCRTGWSKVPITRLSFFKNKGYKVESRGKGRRRIWCVTPGKTEGPKISCSGGNPVRSGSSGGRWICDCPRGKKSVKAGRNHYRCVSTGPVCKNYQFKRGNRCITKPCPRGMTGKQPNCRKIIVDCGRYKRKVGKRCLPIPCGRGFTGNKPNCKPKIAPTCKSIGKIGRWPKCRKKPTLTCKAIGKIGRWPKCRIKIAPTCKSIGKIGRWPKCRKKPTLTCKAIGKTGRWPKCRAKIAPTCKSIGKVGRWPKCRKKPTLTCKAIGKTGRWPKCRAKIAPTCKSIGKVGRWPKCRKKPKLTCKAIGKIGRWPKCRNRPVILKFKKTCAQFGKIGKWPKCRKRAIIK